jgi:hypothetical protein
MQARVFRPKLIRVGGRCASDGAHRVGSRRLDPLAGTAMSKLGVSPKVRPTTTQGYLLGRTFLQRASVRGIASLDLKSQALLLLLQSSSQLGSVELGGRHFGWVVSDEEACEGTSDEK